MTSRASDEFVLHLLRERDKGVPAVALSKLHGVAAQYVSTSTKRVADADFKHDPDGALQAYGWRRHVWLR